MLVKDLNNFKNLDPNILWIAGESINVDNVIDAVISEKQLTLNLEYTSSFKVIHFGSIVQLYESWTSLSQMMNQVKLYHA